MTFPLTGAQVTATSGTRTLRLESNFGTTGASVATRHGEPFALRWAPISIATLAWMSPCVTLAGDMARTSPFTKLKLARNPTTVPGEELFDRHAGC